MSKFKVGDHVTTTTPDKFTEHVGVIVKVYDKMDIDGFMYYVKLTNPPVREPELYKATLFAEDELTLLPRKKRKVV